MLSEKYTPLGFPGAESLYRTEKSKLISDRETVYQIDINVETDRRKNQHLFIIKNSMLKKWAASPLAEISVGNFIYNEDERSYAECYGEDRYGVHICHGPTP